MASATGFPPTTPFIIAIDYGTSSEEVCLVTAVAGLSWTVTRGYDGTSATSHNTAAQVRHTWTAMDGNDSRAHEGSSQGVHGIAPLSFVVGTTDVQTLTNKTLTSPVITGGSQSGTVGGNPTFTSGLKGGSTGQLVVDSAGNLNTSAMVSMYTSNSTLYNGAGVAFANGVPSVSTTVVVPPSGKTDISFGVRQINTTANYVYTDLLIVGSVSGTIRTPTDLTSIATSGPGPDVYSGKRFFITSANPGETLTLTMQHRVTGATGEVRYREIAANPMIG